MRNRELQAAVILDPFRDECFTATLGGGAKLNGVTMKVGEESTALEAVVVTGYAPTDASTEVMLKGMTGNYRCSRSQRHKKRNFRGRIIHINYFARSVSKFTRPNDPHAGKRGDHARLGGVWKSYGVFRSRSEQLGHRSGSITGE